MSDKEKNIFLILAEIGQPLIIFFFIANAFNLSYLLGLTCVVCFKDDNY